MANNIPNEEQSTQRVNKSELLVKGKGTLDALKTSLIFDNYDNLERLMAQSKALVNQMMKDDNVEPQAYDLLWLLSDRLDDMKAEIFTASERTFQ